MVLGDNMAKRQVSLSKSSNANPNTQETPSC